jgi:hypothetical protein
MPMDRGLREAAGVGPFFAVRTEPGEPRGHGFVPLAELYGTEPAAALRDRVDVVAGRLGTPEARVAASLAFQGLAGRLWSLALGPAVLTGYVPDLAPEGLWWHPGRSAPDELWLPDPVALPRAGDVADQVADQVGVAVLHGHLVPLLRATRAVCPVSARLLWGNAGSALAGTLSVLHGWCRAQGRPEAAARAAALARALFADPLLRDTGTTADGASVAPAFVRRSCCLYYRVPGGGLCGDCVLRP